MRLDVVTVGALLATISLCAGVTRAEGAQADAAKVMFNPELKGQSFEQILADCDPATGLPRGVRPPPGASGVILNPTWYERPALEEVAKLYPEAARTAGIAGRAVVSCVVAADGTNRDWRVVEESPAGAGFGEAALTFAKRSRSVPQRHNCVAVGGAFIRFPLSFAP